MVSGCITMFVHVTVSATITGVIMTCQLHYYANYAISTISLENTLSCKIDVTVLLPVQSYLRFWQKKSLSPNHYDVHNTNLLTSLSLSPPETNAVGAHAVVTNEAEIKYPCGNGEVR
jgi:hypothetical protein